MSGISRSPTFILAYLLRYEGFTLREAYFYVKRCVKLHLVYIFSKRHIIDPNRGFWQQLMAYEHSLYGRQTVYMIKPMPDVYLDETSIFDKSYIEAKDFSDDVDSMSKKHQSYDFYDNFVDIFKE